MAIISPTIKTTSSSKLITLAAGCFWGVEHLFNKQFHNKGLVDIKVGYANGIESLTDVNYRKVCLGETNFLEAVQISYEPGQLPLLDILNLFFRMHDPTTVNRQGPDQGTQYRSAIYYQTEEDKQAAIAARDEAQKTWYPHHKIVTQIEPLKIWYDAEDYHQEYLIKNPGGYECPSHFIRTLPKV